MTIIKATDQKREKFSDETIAKAWKRSQGKCECRRSNHGHTEQCEKLLDWNKRGRKNDDYWEAHHGNGDETDASFENCLIFCWGCHRKTFK